MCVQHQTGVELGSARQHLHALGGRQGPVGMAQSADLPVVAICYLALVDPAHINDRDGAGWRSWYQYFPWEDWRRGKPACLTEDIEPRLRAWAGLTHAPCSERLRIAFGWDGVAWDEEKVLERYDILSEAGLLEDAASLASNAGGALRSLPRLRHPILGDHARCLPARSASCGAASNANPWCSS